MIPQFFPCTTFPCRLPRSFQFWLKNYVKSLPTETHFLSKTITTFMSDFRDFWLGFRPLLDFVPTDDESCSMGDTPYESKREIRVRKYFTWKWKMKLTSQWRWYLAACALGPVRTVLDWWLVNQLRELILLKLALAKVEFLVRFL